MHGIDFDTGIKGGEILVAIASENMTKQWVTAENEKYLNWAEQLWMTCMRARHVQQSVLVSLSTHCLRAVCALGKNKPGFPWIMPRYSVTGVDVGRQMWEVWLKWSKEMGAPLQ